MMKYVLYLVALLCCMSIGKNAYAGDARIMIVRVMNWGPGENVDPSVCEFTWKTWVEGGAPEDYDYLKFEPVYSVTPNGNQWVLIFRFDLQGLPEWNSGQILHLELTCDGVKSNPWRIAIPSSQAASNLVMKPEYYLTFPDRFLLNKE